MSDVTVSGSGSSITVDRETRTINVSGVGSGITVGVAAGLTSAAAQALIDAALDDFDPGTGLPDGGTTGQILAKASNTDGDFAFVSPNSANGWLRLDGDGTAPDNRIPSTIARDSEVTAAVAGKEDVGVAAALVAALDLSANWTLTEDTGFTLHREHTTLIPNAETTIGTGWGWPAYPDTAGGFLVGADGTLRHYAAGLTSAFEVGVTTVDGTDIYASPRQEIAVSGAPAIDYCAGGPIVDLGGGVGMMIVHQENGNYPTDYYWTLGCAKVVDDGTTITITYLGDIITHEITEAETITGSFGAAMGSGAYLIHDGYVYVYHPDMDDAGVTHNAVSRCSLADIATAVDTGTPSAPTFNKWAGEALDDPWTTLSLGGDAYPNTSLNSAVVNAGDFLTLPDGRHLWVGAQSNAGPVWGVVYNIATDPLTWDEPQDSSLSINPILPAQGDTEYIYGTLWSGDHDDPKSATRSSVLFTFVNSADLIGRWGDYTVDQLELWPVVGLTDLSGYQLIDPNIQPERIQVSTASTLDLATQVEEPSRVIQTVAPATLTLPELHEHTHTWEIINGSDELAGELVTIEPAAGDTINGTSTSETIRPGDVLNITSSPDDNTWLAWRTSVGAGTRTFSIVNAGAAFSWTAGEIDGDPTNVIGLGANAVVAADIRDGSQLIISNLSDGEYAMVTADPLSAGFPLGLYRVASPTWEFVAPRVGDLALSADSSINDQNIGVAFVYEGGSGQFNGWSYVLWGVIRNAINQFASVFNIDSAYDMAGDDTSLVFFGTVVCTTTDSYTLTLPSAASYFGKTITVVKVESTGTVTVAAQAGDSILAGTTALTGTAHEVRNYRAITSTGWIEVGSNELSLATVATTGDYDDLTDKPTLGTAAAAATGDFATAAQGALADTAVQPADLPTPGVWQLIEEIVLASDQPSVTFADLDDWTEIEVRYRGRLLRTGVADVPLVVQFNGDTGSNYTGTRFGRLGGAVVGADQTATTGGWIGWLPGPQSNTNRRGSGIVRLDTDQDAGARKIVRGESGFGYSTNDTVGALTLAVQWLNSTDPITSMTLSGYLGDIAAGSRFTLIGRT